jgi:hypothetical protein
VATPSGRRHVGHADCGAQNPPRRRCASEAGAVFVTFAREFAWARFNAGAAEAHHNLRRERVRSSSTPFGSGLPSRL